MSILDTVEPNFWIDTDCLEITSSKDEATTWIFDRRPVRALYGYCQVESLLASLTKEHEQRMGEYEEVLTDHRLLVRQLDVLMNGYEGAAAQASLCDIVVMLPAWRDEYRKQVLLELADSLDEKRSNYHFPRISSDELRRMAEGKSDERVM
jgi:hypothetical protein